MQMPGGLSQTQIWRAGKKARSIRLYGGRPGVSCEPRRQFVNSTKSAVWDSSGIHVSARVGPSVSLWFLSSFVARANEILSGHWMDGHRHPAEKSDTYPRSTLVASKTLLELDLDYLERRGGDGLEPEVTSGSGSAAKEEDSPADNLERVKVVFLGAPAVGKSSIIRQFVWNEFLEEYSATDRRETYYPSVVLAERMYKLKITDLPTIPYFPVSSALEWTDFRYYGLRSATAYVLVFDLSNQDTFQYIRTLREQIYESRDMRGVPLLVVGNKQDKLPVGANPSTRHRDIVNLVRKHWRCGYVECSARFNWHVVQVFRELMKSVQAVEGRPPSPAATSSQPLRGHSQEGGAGPDNGGSSDKCILL